MTKDRPRNRPANGRKPGSFRDQGGSKGPDRERAGEQSRGPGESAEARGGGGREKAWGKDRRPGKPFGKPGGKPGSGPPRHQERREASFEENGEVWIWGLHAGGAALANPKRKISKALLSRSGAIRSGLDPESLPRFAEIMEPRDIDNRLPPGAVHQGVAVRCEPLDGLDINDAAMRPDQPLVILDQVTDPQNVGAIFRSAAAFGIGGVVMQTRYAPLAGGALAKAAAGSVESVAEIRAVNISRAIDVLTDAGWKVIGLDGSAQVTLDKAVAGREPVAIVMGAEGSGLRQGVARSCTMLARIPMQPGMESLNVSNAAAIAFYEVMRRNGTAPPAAHKPLPPPDADDGGFDDEAD